MYAFAYIYAVLCSRDGTSYQNTKDQACPVFISEIMMQLQFFYLKGFLKCNGKITNEDILVSKCFCKGNSTSEFEIYAVEVLNWYTTTVRNFLALQCFEHCNILTFEQVTLFLCRS